MKDEQFPHSISLSNSTSSSDDTLTSGYFNFNDGYLEISAPVSTATYINTDYVIYDHDPIYDLFLKEPLSPTMQVLARACANLKEVKDSYTPILKFTNFPSYNWPSTNWNISSGGQITVSSGLTISGYLQTSEPGLRPTVQIEED